MVRLSEGKIDMISRKFIVNDNKAEKLKHGQQVDVRLSSKKGSKVKSVESESIHVSKGRKGYASPKKETKETGTARRAYQTM